MLKRKQPVFVAEWKVGGRGEKNGKKKLCLVQTKWLNFIFNKGKAIQNLIYKSSTEVAVTQAAGCLNRSTFAV